MAEATDTSLPQFWRLASAGSRLPADLFLVRAPMVGLMPLQKEDKAPEQRVQALISTLSFALFPEDFCKLYLPILY